MALLNNCRFQAPGTGTGAFADGTAVAGCRNMAAAGAVNAATYPYKAQNAAKTEWEFGVGTYSSAGGGTLSRGAIIDSTNGGAAVNFTTAPFVILTARAADFPSTPALVKATIAQARAATTGDFAVFAETLETAAAGVALSDAATVAVDWDAAINFTLTVTANRIIGNPTNGQPGTHRSILVQGNDGTDRTITFGNQFLGDVPTITDCDNNKWYLLTIFCITTSHFVVSKKVAKT